MMKKVLRLLGVANVALLALQFAPAEARADDNGMNGSFNCCQESVEGSKFCCTTCCVFFGTRCASSTSCGIQQT